MPWARVGNAQFSAHCAAPLRDIAARWTWDDGGLLVLGPTGIGKTVMKVALARRLLWDGAREGGRIWARARRIGWTRAVALSQARKEHSLGSGEPREVESAKRYSLLFIDEAGYLDNERDATLAEVVTERDYRNAPTVLSSGMTASEFEARYGAAIARKLCERGRLIDLHRAAGKVAA